MTRPKTATKTRKPSGRSLTPEERKALGQTRMTLWLSRDVAEVLDVLAVESEESRTATLVRLVREAAAKLRKK